MLLLWRLERAHEYLVEVLLMNREARKRQLNEAIVKMLYPPPPDPDPEPPPSQSDGELKPVEGFSSDVVSGNASSSGDEEQGCEMQKLSRAQRKKIRKRRLKEEAIRRGKLIGPLLPVTPTDQCGDVVVEGPPAVRSNSSEEDFGADEPGGCGKLKKLKHRRMAKRLAKEGRNSSCSNNCNQQSTSSSGLDPKEATMQ